VRFPCSTVNSRIGKILFQTIVCESKNRKNIQKQERGGGILEDMLEINFPVNAPSTLQENAITGVLDDDDNEEEVEEVTQTRLTEHEKLELMP